MIQDYRVKLIRDGVGQVIQIPKTLELPGNEAILRANGDYLIIEAAQDVSALRELGPLNEGFPNIDDF